MNKLFKLLFIDFKLMSKNKMVYLKLILFPTILILILSFANKNKSDFKVDPFNVAFLSQDSAINENGKNVCLGDNLKNQVFQSKDVKSLIKLKQVKSYDEGESLVTKGKVFAFVYVPENFTKNYYNDTQTEITLKAAKDKPLHKSIVKNILNNFKLSLNNTSNNYNIPTATSNSKLKSISILQYICIGIVVMFSIMTAFIIIHNMLDEKLNNTFFRIKTTPTSNLEYCIGKLLSIVFVMVLQMTTVMIISHILFKANWGNLFYTLTITIFYGFAIGSIVLLAGFLSKDHATITSLATPILFILSFLGGSFGNTDSFPSTIHHLQKIVPNGAALNAFVKISQGGNIKAISSELIYLISIGIIFLSICLLIQNKNEVDVHGTFRNDKKTGKIAVQK